eukprot:760559-Hanusia_phi.AAC.1
MGQGEECLVLLSSPADLQHEDHQSLGRQDERVQTCPEGTFPGCVGSSPSPRQQVAFWISRQDDQIVGHSGRKVYRNLDGYDQSKKGMEGGEVKKEVKKVREGEERVRGVGITRSRGGAGGRGEEESGAAMAGGGMEAVGSMSLKYFYKVTVIVFVHLSCYLMAKLLLLVSPLASFSPSLPSFSPSLLLAYLICLVIEHRCH